MIITWWFEVSYNKCYIVTSPGLCQCCIDSKIVYCRPVGLISIHIYTNDSITGSWRYIRIRGYGHFLNRYVIAIWWSPYSSCIIYLWQQRMIYRYIQQCCQWEANCKPNFMDDAKKKAKYAAKYFSKKERDLPMWVLPQTLWGVITRLTYVKCVIRRLFVKLSGSNSDNSGQSSLNNSYSYTSQVSRPTPTLLSSRLLFGILCIQNWRESCCVMQELEHWACIW